MEEFKSFETERLIIKPTTTNDAAFIYELFNSPKWINFIGDRDISSVKKAEDYIESNMLPQLRKLGYSNFTLILKEDNSKIGICGLYDRPGLDYIDIGFAFLPAYERKGFAFEASKEVKDRAFDTFGLDTLIAITREENIGSQKLLKKLNMKASGSVYLPNDNEKWLVYKAERM